MGFSGASIQFGVIMTPAGGCYVENESLNCVISRKTIITIKNKDDNCFCFALLASCNVGSKTKVNQCHKPNIISKARELFIQCNCEFNKCVNFIALSVMAGKLNTNIYILEIGDLHIIKPDVNLYNHLLYKSENIHNGEHCLLYDSVHSHFHVITDIRKCFGANFYCNECCRCFKSENTYDNHFHDLCSILSDEKIQPVNKSRRLAK
jgi:hypothetical protein